MATASIPRLADFYISEKTGFLIEEPLTSLPSFFDPWNDIGRNLADLLTQHSLREVVDKMPLLDHARLTGHRQWRLAYTILSFIGHGYVWQEGETTPAKKIPRQLAIPWYGVSSYLGLHPAVAQVNTVLSNWQIIDPARPMSVDNMRLICEFPGGTHCRWFFMTTGQIEMDVIHGLKAMLKAKEYILSNDSEGVHQALDDIADNIKLLKADASRMHEKLDADVFFKEIRPFLSGWGGKGSALPEGLLFEGVSDTPLQVVGASAAQSSTLQCFDAALGITHGPDQQEFLDLMKTYMPSAHAKFIASLREQPSIREFVMNCHDDEVVKSYERCIDALAEFRSYHIQLTTKYILSKGKTQIGSGGTAFTSFLKSVRDTTKAAKLDYIN